MIWKITNLTVSQNLPPGFYQSISGNTYQPQNIETDADITITFRNFDINENMGVEEFERQMKMSELEFEGNYFTRDEMLEALQEKYPERFI